MSDVNGADGNARSNWENLLRSMMGESAAREAMEALEASGFDPSQMAEAAGLPQDPAALRAMMAQIIAADALS